MAGVNPVDETMIFNYETSHRTYYRDGEIGPIIKTVYEEKPPCPRIRPPPLRYIHSLVDWKNARVPPFNLFHKPKDIVHTNPKESQRPHEKPIDIDLENAKKTRPRIFITPAVSLDDVPPEERKVLIDQTYISTAQRAARDCVLAKASVKAPFPAQMAPANPFIFHQKLRPLYVHPEWRMPSAAWEGRQLRAHCNPTREFFKGMPLNCDVCKFSEAREAKIKLEKQMKMKKY